MPSNVTKNFGEVLGGEAGRRWEATRGRVNKYLESLGVSENTFTCAAYLHPLKTTNAARVLEHLRAATADEELWDFLVAHSGGMNQQDVVLAMPVRRSSAPGFLFPFVEVHSRLGVWWLTTAWRALQFTVATWDQADKHAVLPTAACARALMETAAASWHDAHRLRDCWNDAKSIEPAMGTGGVWAAWRPLVSLLWEIQYGAKFDDRVPDLKRTWGRVQRVNVLSQLDKLAKVTSGCSLTEAYQWLCNTVHPSVGGTLAFSSPGMGHRTDTHHLNWFAPFPTSIVEPSHGGRESAERTVHMAIVEGATAAVSIVLETLDASLHVVDDVCLTTDVGRVSGFDNWRRLERPARNERCPCRSGKKGKSCIHRWAMPAPELPERFTFEELQPHPSSPRARTEGS
jgi:hypothetical protein